MRKPRNKLYFSDDEVLDLKKGVESVIHNHVTFASMYPMVEKDETYEQKLAEYNDILEKLIEELKFRNINF